MYKPNILTSFFHEFTFQSIVISFSELKSASRNDILAFIWKMLSFDNIKIWSSRNSKLDLPWHHSIQNGFLCELEEQPTDSHNYFVIHFNLF